MRSRMAASSSSLLRASRKEAARARAAGSGSAVVISSALMASPAGKETLHVQTDQRVQAARAEALQVEGHEAEAQLAQPGRQRLAHPRLRQAGQGGRRHLDAGQFAL